MRLPSIWTRFTAERRGNVAITFALASFPLLAFTGAAIDYGMATRLQAKLQAATDATALNLCQTPLTTTTPQLQAQAAIVAAGYMGSTSSLTIEALAVTSNPRQITLKTHIQSQTFFPRITGVSSPSVAAQSQCATPMPATFEIALVLDNTGSMSETSNQQSKLQALQKAAASFVDYVKNNSAFSSLSRISIVPFSAAVAVDPTAYASATWVDTAGVSSYHWNNVDKTSARAAGFTSRLSIFNKLKTIYSSWGWAGCFEALPYPQSTQDISPNSNDTLYVPMFAPDEPGDATSTYTCWGSGNNCQAYAYNSYINDGDGSANCPSPTSPYATAENQACKYANPKNAKSSSYLGIPNGPNFQCASKPLQRLTTDGSVLKSLITSMVAQGSTNIFDGMMWGWRTLSPNSVFADGASYQSSTKKIIVLMTDGTNTWSGFPYNPNQSLYFPFGYMVNADGTNPNSRLPPGFQSPNSDDARRASLDELTRQACVNAKAAGIGIYTIGFSIPSDPIDATGKQLLQNCASSVGQAFIANDSNGLIAAFSQIAQSIGALRISQ